MDNFVSSAGNPIDIDAIEGLEDFICTLLVFVHGADDPHIIIAVRDGVLGWKRNK